MTRVTNFYEELPVADDDAIEESDQDQPKDTRAHILSSEELDAWKNGTDDGPVLRRAADIKAEEDPDAKDEVPTDDEEQEEDKPAEVSAPDPFAVSVADPGEFAPKDYSFEVSVYDAEGKNPKAVKITSVDQWDELVETDPNLGSGGAVLKAQRQATRMENGIERDRESYESKKRAFDEAKAASEQQTKEVAQWDAELDYLSSKGKLPTITKELKEANWNDPEVAAQPAVKARVDLMKYMDRESKARMKLGLPKINSVLDAHNAWLNDKTESDKAASHKAASDHRKAAGARIGGSQPAQATNAPKGITVGRVSPGGLRDMGVRF